MTFFEAFRLVYNRQPTLTEAGQFVNDYVGQQNIIDQAIRMQGEKSQTLSDPVPDPVPEVVPEEVVPDPDPDPEPEPDPIKQIRGVTKVPGGYKQQTMNMATKPTTFIDYFIPESEVSNISSPNSLGQYTIDVPKSYRNKYTYTEGQDAVPQVGGGSGYQQGRDAIPPTITKIGTSDTQTVDDFLAGKPFPSEVEPEVEPEVVSEEVVSEVVPEVVSEEVVSGGQFGDIPQDQLDFYEEIGYGTGGDNDPSIDQIIEDVSGGDASGGEGGDASGGGGEDDSEVPTGDLDSQGFTRLDKDKFYYTETTSKFIQGTGMGDTSRTEQVTTYYDQDGNILGTGDAGKNAALAKGLTFSSGPKAPTSELNADRIRRGYEDILFRTPNQQEIDSYRNTKAADFIGNLKNSLEYSSPQRGIRSIYKEVAGRLPDEQELNTNLGIVGESLSSLEGKQLAGKLRGEQLGNLRGRLGIATERTVPDETTDSGVRTVPFFSGFNKAPVTEGAEATAGINRLLPAEANRTNTFYNLTQDPRFTAPDYGQFGREVEKARIADELGEGAGKSLFPLFQDVFGQDYKQGIRDELTEELTPGIRAQVEADIAAKAAAEQAAAEGGMYAGGLATLSEANIFKKGGEVDNMGLEGLGQKMAAYGRYGDTMLAHISPEEAMMLKAMGGSGTRNPVTGLPEFFLKKIFKIFKSILPAAVAVVNPPLGAALAAADAGFKDGKFNLKKAALAGIKTYALSKVGQKISGVEATPTAGDVGMQTIGKDTTPFLKSATAPSIGDQLTQPLTDPGQFASDVGRVGSGFKDAAGEFAQGDFSRLKGTAVPGTVAGLTYSAEAGMKEAEKIKREADALNYDAEKRKKEQERKALAALAPGFGYAQGGISSLAPRYLDGAGDGMSDSIRANIDGQQEARLADGEFVIPADVVADMGNGSSNAGAERLYSMMDRIREARHGTTKQPPEVNVNRMMPA